MGLALRRVSAGSPWARSVALPAGAVEVLGGPSMVCTSSASGDVVGGVCFEIQPPPPLPQAVDHHASERGRCLHQFAPPPHHSSASRRPQGEAASVGRALCVHCASVVPSWDSAASLVEQSSGGSVDDRVPRALGNSMSPARLPHPMCHAARRPSVGVRGGRACQRVLACQQGKGRNGRLSRPPASPAGTGEARGGVARPVAATAACQGPGA